MRIRVGGGVEVRFHLARMDPPGAERTTHDCDVVAWEPAAAMEAVLAAARAAAAGTVHPRWLNRDASMFAHRLPPGWTQRLIVAEEFGALVLEVLGRRDLLAMKLASVAHRPVDRADLLALRPSREECGFLEAELDRRERESFDREALDRERGFLRDLRGSLSGGAA